MHYITINLPSRILQIFHLWADPLSHQPTDWWIWIYQRETSISNLVRLWVILHNIFYWTSFYPTPMPLIYSPILSFYYDLGKMALDSLPSPSDWSAYCYPVQPSITSTRNHQSIPKVSPDSHIASITISPRNRGIFYSQYFFGTIPDTATLSPII